jgi:endonuclease/exonuclease/phosphatase family metal-dependent hydrolase
MHASTSCWTAAGEPFVIMGDLNADPVGGDSYQGAINQLLDCCRTNGAFIPKSAGGAEDGPSSNNNKTDPASKTSSFGLRVDYALPSRSVHQAQPCLLPGKLPCITVHVSKRPSMIKCSMISLVSGGS